MSTKENLREYIGGVIGIIGTLGFAIAFLVMEICENCIRALNKILGEATMFEPFDRKIFVEVDRLYNEAYNLRIKGDKVFLEAMEAGRKGHEFFDEAIKLRAESLNLAVEAKRLFNESHNLRAKILSEIKTEVNNE
jgi:hypothetical protein